MSRRGLLLLAALFAGGCSKKSEAAPAPTGRDLFVVTCARCHGMEGTGGLPLWDGGPSPRNFHDHTFQSQRTDAQLRETIKTGKGSGMPPFGGALDEAQIASLVTYLRTLDSPEGK